MLSEQILEHARLDAIRYFEKAGIALTEEEKTNIEVADFGLGNLDTIGLEVLVYVNTERVCAKELVIFPNQTCPEHRHPSRKGVPGKEETFRCRYGTVYLYVPGKPTANPRMQGLEGHTDYLTVYHEIVLHPGDQYTLSPDTLHWFRSGDRGAIVSEFSTTSTDDQDVFTDPRINRFTVIGEQ
jgi:D-lyxose ketol-isomerase